MRYPTVPVSKEGKIIDVSTINYQVLNPLDRYYHEDTQYLCDMSLNTSNIEVAMISSQLQPPLLEASLPIIPTTIHIIPLELS
jgi:hypothetical protein